jgi:hypothetical protein
MPGATLLDEFEKSYVRHGRERSCCWINIYSEVTIRSRITSKKYRQAPDIVALSLTALKATLLVHILV